MHIYRKAAETDFAGIKELYKKTAEQKNGISRTPEEITDDFISKVLYDSLKTGLIMVSETDGIITGAVNALRFEQECFSHVLSDLTFVIHPYHQGKGAGKALFGTFLQEIDEKMPEITRIELFVRDNNKKAQRLYKSFGFEKEGLLKHRIKNADGIPEADVIMARVTAP